MEVNITRPPALGDSFRDPQTRTVDARWRCEPNAPSDSYHTHRAMLNQRRDYFVGICTGVGIALTLLAVGARFGLIASDALLDLGCLFAGICLVLFGTAVWWRQQRTSAAPPSAPDPAQDR